MEEITFRKAIYEDAKIYFEWANDPDTRRNSFHSEKIIWEDHIQWFMTKLQSNSSFLYIALVGQNPVGQIRFEVENHNAELSYSVAPQWRGQGIGRELLVQSLPLIKKEVKYLKTVSGKVKPDNITSIKLFEKNAYIRINENNNFVEFQRTIENI